MNRGLYGHPAGGAGAPGYGPAAAKPTATGSGLTYVATDEGNGSSYIDAAPGTWKKASSGVPVFTASTSRNLRKGLARVRSNQGDAKILCVGDSTTGGVGADGTTNLGTANCYPSQLARALNQYIPAAPGMGPGKQASNPNPMWTLGTGWSIDGLGLASGLEWNTPTSGNLVYADTVLCDSYDVYYIKTGSSGTLTATASGGTPVVVNTNGSNSIAKLTAVAASASASNTLTITGATSTCYVLSIEPYLSTINKVRVANVGIGGGQVSNANLGSGGFSTGAHLTLYAPDLIIISYGINDASANKSVVEYASGIESWITTANAIGSDVLLMSPNPTSSVTTATAQYLAYLKARGLPYADMVERWTSYTVSNSLGMMYDSLHPNAYGYGDLGNWLASLIARA